MEAVAVIMMILTSINYVETKQKAENMFQKFIALMEHNELSLIVIVI